MEQLLRNIDCLQVRISTEKGANLLGSGVIYRRNIGEDILILTCAHVLWEFFYEADEDGEYTKIHNSAEVTFDIFDTDDQLHTITETISIADQAQTNAIYFHEEYTEDPEFDAAIITLAWDHTGNWMEKFERLLPRNARYTSPMTWGGYTGSKDPAWTDRMLTVEKSRKRAIGKAYSNFHDVSLNTSPRGDQPLILLDYPNNVNENQKKELVLGGYSGSGIFHYDREVPELIGCVCELPKDEEPRGVYATNVNIFMEIIELYQLGEDLPDTLRDYLKSVLESKFDDPETITLFLKEYDHIDHTKEKTDIAKNLEFLKEVLCLREKRSTCESYLNGQAVKILCFHNYQTGQNHMPDTVSIDIGGQSDEVSLVFMCSEETSMDFFKRLVRDGIPSAGNTIYLWNNHNKKGLYDMVYERKAIQNLVFSQTKGCEERTSSPTKGFTDTKDIAIIGVGSLLHRVLIQAFTNHKTKETCLKELLEQVWRI